MSLFYEELPGLISCRLDPTTLRGRVGPSAIDTRHMKRGDLFWALKGDGADGHDYVAESFVRGAQAAVVSEEWHQQAKSIPGAKYVVVSETLKALQKLAKMHRSRFYLPVIALTGSNGKTATKEHLAAALRRRYKLVKSPGNYNNHIGVPLTLLEISPKTELAIVEMGANRPGDIALLCSLAQPQYGMVLNVGPVHLEGFKDLEGVAKEKGILLESLPSNATAFINCDDPYVRGMSTRAETYVCFGFNTALASERCDKMVCAEELDLTPQGKGRFRLRDTEFTLNWYGRHQVKNALAAAAVADYFGVPLDEIASAFDILPPIEGRMDVEEVEGITLINDAYNANAVSSEAALDFMDSFSTTGRKYAVFGDHLELGEASEAEHRRIGQMLKARRLDGVFLIGCEMGYAREEIGDLVLYHQEDSTDVEELVSKIGRKLRAGDAVILKASHGMGFDRIHAGIKHYLTKDQT